MDGKLKNPKATFYIWTRLPKNELKSMEFVKKLINIGVIITPGVGFGQHGEGYVRFALTHPIYRIKEAIERINSLLN